MKITDQPSTKRLTSIVGLIASCAILLVSHIAQGETRRVCIEFDQSKRSVVTLKFGYSIYRWTTDVDRRQLRRLFQEKASDTWALSFPADNFSQIKPARDRPDITMDADLVLSVKDFTPILPIQKQFWNPGEERAEIARTCLRWAETSLAELDRITVRIKLRSPALRQTLWSRKTRCEDFAHVFAEPRPDLSFNDVEACEYKGIFHYFSFSGAKVGDQYVNLTQGGRAKVPGPDGPAGMGFNFGIIGVYTTTLNRPLRDWRIAYDVLIRFLEDASARAGDVQQ